MRPVLIAILTFMLAGFLFLGFVSTSQVVVQSAPQAIIEPTGPNLPRKQARDRINPEFQVRGEPRANEQDAVTDALVQAQIELEKYLQTLSPPVYWRPPLEYIRQHLAKNLNLIKVLLKDASHQAALSAEANTDSPIRAEFTIEISSPVRREMLYLARQDRSWDRMILLAPVLAGVVLLLMAASSYIHLDEQTKGYYTGWLRLVAAGAVIAFVAGGWWWFTQGPTQ